MRRVLESKIQKAARDAVRARLGVSSVKLATPGETGYPDVVFFIPGGRPLFVEYKRPGEPLRPKQEHVGEELRKLGYDVEPQDSVDGTLRAVARALEAARLAADGGKVAAGVRRGRPVRRPRRG